MSFTENENKGFSLVELIVVIAIMAVLTSVLAPSLLGYVENSRMQKDDYAMGEITNAVKLALADQKVYDECLSFNVTNNFSCYADSASIASANTRKVIDRCYNGVDHTAEGKSAPCESGGADSSTKSDAWHYDDSTRMADESPYIPSGYMRGFTITFTPINVGQSTEFDLPNAKINKMSNAPTGQNARTLAYKYTTPQGDVTLSNMSGDGNGLLYNRLLATIGYNNISLGSQTYRNSEYTVFVRMGSMGGNDASKQDAIAVYGQWNGTNLNATNQGGQGGGNQQGENQGE